MFQKILMIILILVIVLAGGFYAYQELMPQPEQETQAPVYATEEVIRGDISVGVETTGRLHPSNSGGLRIPGNHNDSGQVTIEEYLVEEGEEVKQGQVVALLRTTDIENQIENKKLDLQIEREDLAAMVGGPVSEVDSINPAQGITISAPIDGMITDLNVEEGMKLDRSIVARIVDNSKFLVEAHVFQAEYNKVEVGQEVVLSFPYFDGQYKGVLKHINPNRIPFSSREGDFAKTFVYLVTIEAENMGLAQRDMEVRVGVRSEQNVGPIYYFSNTAKITGFIKEDTVINTLEDSMATKVHVDNMANVKAGDPIVTMAGADTRARIQEKMNRIREINMEIRALNDALNEMEVRAPMDGIVAQFHRSVGESIRMGEWIGSIYNVSDMRMMTEVDDIDVIHVQQGAPVIVTVDALVAQAFEGEVEQVSATGQHSNGVSKFHVQIKVQGGADLRPGMQARAFIDAGSAEDVLLVPLEAIFEEDNNHMVEILDKEGFPQIVPVRLGLMSDRYAEVQSGLEEGDLVVVGSSADLLPSQRIQSQGGLLPESGGGDNGEPGRE